MRHTTTYDYAGNVDLASHMLHLLPRPLAHQRVLSVNLGANPEPARMVERLDHFGNRVAWMFLNRPHDRFEVTLAAEVDVAFPPPPADMTPAWEAVAAQASGDHAAWREAEFAFESPMLAEDAAATAYVAESFPPGRAVLEALLHLNSRIRATQMSFLQNMLSQGLLGSADGSLPFSVICDLTNNPAIPWLLDCRIKPGNDGGEKGRDPPS